jgi:hypothetical protein
MKPSADLHELIFTLSPAEKRYFRLSAGGSDSGNNYVRLFDAIAAQEEYDEDLLKAKFKGETFLKHLSSEKNYLYNAILKAMRGYHEGANADARIMVMLSEIHFLFERHLYSQCQKAVGRALKLAEEFQRTAFVFLILDWQSRVEKILRAKDLGSCMEELGRQRTAALEALSRSMDIAIGYDRFYAHASTSYLPDSEGLAGLSIPALPDPLPGERFESLLRLHTAKALQAQFQVDFALANKHFEAAAATWEQHPHFMDDNPGDYLRTLANLLAGLHNLEDYARFPEVLAKLRGIRQGSFSVELGQFAFGDYYQLLYHLAMGQFKEGLALAGAVLAGLKRFSRQIPASKALAFRYNLGLLHFFAGKRKLALDHFRYIIDLPEHGIRGDLRVAARILFLLIHVDLGNHDFLEGQARNLRRMLDRKQETFAFEELVLRYVEAVAKDQGAGGPAYGLADLESGLLQLVTAHGKGNRTGLDEVRAWIEHRKTGVALEFVVGKRQSERECESERE